MKRISALILTLSMLLTLTACGKTVVPEEDPQVQEILSKAEARRQAILNSETAIVKSDTYVMGETYTGTAYYISNNGDDKNNGRSPETPFATVEPLRNIEMQFGDAIFFERGGLWRSCEMPGDVLATEGITFSAYGEGEKPRLYASSENGAGGEKWSLYYEDGDGKKIWVYYKDMAECGAIVAGEDTPVKRDVAYWNGSKYIKLNEMDELTQDDYRVEEHLQDMWCFPFLEYSEQDLEDGRAFRSWNFDTRSYDYVTGPLYFRCDEGNPGELYDSIEFIQPYAFSDGFADYTVYDNLDYCYSTCTLTNGNSCYGAVQNCEIAWMGGNVAAYATGMETGDTRVTLNGGLFGRMGGGISVGNGYLIQNNYVHNCFQEGIAVETIDGDPSIEDTHISGNLVTHCVQSLLLCNWDMEVNENHIFKNCVFEDNIVLYSGKNNFLNHKWHEDLDCAAFIMQGGPCAHDGTLAVRNNTFAFSRADLIQIDVYSKEYSQVFDGNTYAQFPKMKWLYVEASDGEFTNPKKAITDLMADKNANIIRFDK